MEKSQKRTAKTKGEVSDGGRDREGLHDGAAIFPTAEDFSKAADRYFAECDATDTLYDEAGLCLYLSKHNAKKRTVSLRALRSWYDGEAEEHLQEAVELAYLRMQHQIATDLRYQEKSGMTTRASFLMRQSRFGGYQDKAEQKSGTTVTVVHGKTMDASDFE